MYEDKQKIQDLMAEGRLQETLLLAQKLYESSPDDQDVLILSGLIYSAMKNYRAGESCFRKVVSISPDNPRANLGLAAHWLECGASGTPSSIIAVFFALNRICPVCILIWVTACNMKEKLRRR